LNERGQAVAATQDVPDRAERVAADPIPWSLVLTLGAAIALAAWPRLDFRLPPGSYLLWGLDFSWVVALHLAALQHLQWGRDILFTYGPLGFLSFPSVALPETSALGLFCVAAMMWLLAVTFLLALQRWLPLLAACAASFLGVVLVGVLLFPEAACVAGVLLAGLVLAGGLGSRAEEVATVVVAALAALLLLMKTSSGVTLSLAVPLLVWAAPANRLRRGLTAGIGFAAVLAAAWLAAGQSISGFPRWLYGAFLMASNYTESMAIQEPARRWEDVALAVYLAVFWLAFAGGCARGSPRRVAALVVLLAGAGWLFVKAGFVRHVGHGHSPITFGFLLVAPLMVPWRRRWRPVGLGLAASAGLLLAVARGVAPFALFDLRARARELSFELSTVASSEARAERAASAKARIRRDFPLPPAVLDALKGHRVHVDPHDVAILWANSLDWEPLPVFQAYAAYAPALDRMNAERLADARGPDRILRRRLIESIDGRSPWWETPESTLARLCRFEPVASSEIWQVLERGPDRCGTERPIDSVRAEPGSAAKVPLPSEANRVVVAHLDAQASFAERLETALWRPPRLLYFRLGDRRLRLVRANLGGPLLLRVPQTSDWPPDGGLSIDSIQIEGASSPIEVRFAEIPLGAPAPP
jgi:hypothetical protein